MRNVILLNLFGFIVMTGSSAHAVDFNRFKSKQVSTGNKIRPINKAQDLTVPITEISTNKSDGTTSNLANDNQTPSVNSSIVEVNGNTLQQYIMRGRGPSYRGTKVDIRQDQILSIKVDFGYDEAFRNLLFHPNSNAAFRYQTHIYTVNSLEGLAALASYSSYATNAISTYGHFSPEARAARNTAVYRLYKENRYSVYVSNEAGALRNDSSCIYPAGDGDVDFNFQQRVPQAASSGDCSDVRANKVWYINVKLNHCDYTAVFKNAQGQYVREERTDGNCAAQFTLYQDLLYYN